MSRRVITFLLVAASAAGVAAQPPSIRGRVVDDATGQPLRNAAVRTGAPDSIAVATDESGRFVVPATPSAILSASKGGYADSSASAVDGIEIRLPRGGVITGRVVDDLGLPLPLVTVVAQRVAADRRSAATAAHAESDDTGAFRLFGLPAGDFVVALGGRRTFGGGSVTPLPRPVNEDLLRNYYPRARTLEAATVLHVDAGAEISGIDVAIGSDGAAQGAVREPPRAASNGTAVIRGRILSGDGGPVRRARVELSSSARLFSPATVQSDDDGRYEFTGVQAGGYFVSVTDATLSTARYGQHRAGDRGDILNVATGAAVEGVDITVPRGSVIGGRIVDAFGDPVANASVRVDQIRARGGRMRLVRVNGVAGQQTNDLGRFRLFGLPPGRYILDAVVGEDVTAFFPGTAQLSEAQLVEVAAGVDALNVDFPLVRGTTRRVSGRALDASGRPLEGLVNLAPSVRSNAVVSNDFPKRMRIDGGAFVFDRLPAGEYVVQASSGARSRADEGEFGALFVTVGDQDVDGVLIRLSAGSSVTGRITFDGDPPTTTDGFEVTSIAADPDLASLADNAAARAEPADDWTFEMDGLNGPRRLTARTPEGWMVKSVTVNRLDVTDAPLPFGSQEQSLADVDVRLTRDVTVVRVTATDRAGAPAKDAAVFVFSADRSRWYSQTRFANGGAAIDGVATIRALPAGDYYVAAIDTGNGAPDPQAEMTPTEFLETLVPAAARITIADGQHVSTTVRVR